MAEPKSVLSEVQQLLARVFGFRTKERPFFEDEMAKIADSPTDNLRRAQGYAAQHGEVDPRSPQVDPSKYKQYVKDLNDRHFQQMQTSKSAFELNMERIPQEQQRKWQDFQPNVASDALPYVPYPDPKWAKPPKGR